MIDSASHTQIIDQLQTVILQTIDLIEQFEAHGLQHSADYTELWRILHTAQQTQRQHIAALLG